MDENERSLFEAAEARPNIPEFTVSELARAIRAALEGGFPRVRVRGELSGLKRAGSGHLYFRLKDTDAVLDAVAWRSTASRLGIVPEEGLEVIATGRISSYPGRSSYQLIVESMELAGEGALLKLLEERRRRLAAEGLFDAARKRSLPFLPQVIGVVTSPTGAVIRDILHRLRDRFPRRVIVWPVLVQGEAAAGQVAAAIRGFNALAPEGPVPRPDVLIVARGGGSLEDLWAFNEEIVVRAAAESAIPLIAAVGHETDTTLIDFAADRRAPTPTAAAEIAVPVRAELETRVLGLAQRQVGCFHRMLDERRTRVRGLARGLPDAVRLIETAAQRTDDCGERLSIAWRTLADRRRSRLAEVAGRLRHPREVMALQGERLAAIGRAIDRAAAARLERAEAGLGRLAAERRLGACAARAIETAAARLEHASRLLESCSYRRVLDRGFVLVRHGGHPVVHAADTRPGMGVSLQFADAEVDAVIGDGAMADAAPRPRRKGGRDDDDQGRLL